MNTYSFLNWSFNVWPDHIRTDSTGLLSHKADTLLYAMNHQVRSHAYAIGFFGFHYIRAVNDNEDLLQRESLQILQRLVTASDLDASLMRQLQTSEKQSYADYWNTVMLKVSWALGDSQGTCVQYGVKLSFWLAAAYACLYGVLRDERPSQITRYLAALENWIPELLVSAKQAEMPETALAPLAEMKKLLQGRKNNSTALHCKRNLETTLRRILLPITTTMGL